MTRIVPPRASLHGFEVQLAELAAQLCLLLFSGQSSHSRHMDEDTGQRALICSPFQPRSQPSFCFFVFLESLGTARASTSDAANLHHTTTMRRYDLGKGQENRTRFFGYICWCTPMTNITNQPLVSCVVWGSFLQVLSYYIYRYMDDLGHGCHRFGLLGPAGPWVSIALWP